MKMLFPGDEFHLILDKFKKPYCIDINNVAGKIFAGIFIDGLRGKAFQKHLGVLHGHIPTGTDNVERDIFRVFCIEDISDDTGSQNNQCGYDDFLILHRCDYILNINKKQAVLPDGWRLVIRLVAKAEYVNSD